MFRRIVCSACLAGAVSGAILTGVQTLQVVPIILEAESYEARAQAAQVHGRADAQPPAESRAPAQGWERTLRTAAANVGMAIGFGMLLTAAFSLRGAVDWKHGLAWGVGGYITFFVAPSVGLPPEIPGAEAAALEPRQAWWAATVALTGIGLGCLAFGRHWALKLLGLVLTALPHAIGAPQPEPHGGVAPAELASSFIIATAIANAIFWAVLGTSGAIVYNKLA